MEILLDCNYYQLKKYDYCYEICSTEKNPRLLCLGIDMVHDELIKKYIDFFKSTKKTFKMQKWYENDTIFPESITGEKRKRDWYSSFNGDGFIIPFDGVLDFYKCLNKYLEVKCNNNALEL